MKIDITKLSEGRLNYMKKRAAKLDLTLKKYVELNRSFPSAFGFIEGHPTTIPIPSEAFNSLAMEALPN